MKRLLLLSVATLVSVLMLVPVSSSAQILEDERPNIVFFITDDLDKLLVDQMPSVKRTVGGGGGGVNFDRAYVADPFCCPSRASILTGLYVQHHGIWNNSGPNGGAEGFRDKGNEERTIALALQESGYRTGLVGKYMNGNTTRIPVGWDRWHGWVGDLHADNFRVNNNGRVETCNPKNCHDTDYLSDKSVGFIRSSARSGEPFFLYHSTNAPHDPKEPYVAKRYRDALPKFRLRKTPSYNETDLSDKPRWVRSQARKKTSNTYNSLSGAQRWRARGMLSVMDSYRELVRTLKETGEYENTYIIFTSDNGKFQGDHGLGVGKRSPYLHDIEVPLYIKGPGIVPHKETRLVSNVDYYATFADMANIRNPRTTDGASMLPLLRNRPVEGGWRKRIFVEGYAEASVNAPFRIPSFTEIVENKTTYTKYETGETEYYDLARDPWQLEATPGKGEFKRRMNSLIKRFDGCEIGECKALER